MCVKQDHFGSILKSVLGEEFILLLHILKVEGILKADITSIPCLNKSCALLSVILVDHLLYTA